MSTIALEAELWQQAVLAIFTVLLVSLIGWILFGPEPIASSKSGGEGAEEEEEIPFQILPVFGANFTEQALKQSKRAGVRRRKNQLSTNAGQTTEKPADQMAAVEESQRVDNDAAGQTRRAKPPLTLPVTSKAAVEAEQAFHQAVADRRPSSDVTAEEKSGADEEQEDFQRTARKKKNRKQKKLIKRKKSEEESGHADEDEASEPLDAAFADEQDNTGSIPAVASAPTEEEEEETAEDMDDPLAMMGGMALEEVYKISCVEEAVVAEEACEGDADEPSTKMEDTLQEEPCDAADEEAEEEEAESSAVDAGVDAAETAADPEDEMDPFAMLGGMGQEEVYKITKVTEAKPDEVAEEICDGIDAKVPALTRNFEIIKPVYAPTEREKDIMKCKKKIREIEDLERKQQDGVKLAKNQEDKLSKKAALLEELEAVERCTDTQMVQYDATVLEIMNPIFGVMLKVDGKADPVPMSAAHMNPPIHADQLFDIAQRYRKGQDLKVRIMRQLMGRPNVATCTDMSEEDEELRHGESEQILRDLEVIQKTEKTEIQEELWNASKGDEWNREWDWSSKDFDGIVTSVKDVCVFVRVLGCREVRVSASNMSPKMTFKDSVSDVLKVQRDAVPVGAQMPVQLKWAWSPQIQDYTVIGAILNEPSAQD